MGATIQRGTTFTTAQQNITAAQFTTLLTAAVITDIARDNVKTTETLATQAATRPSSPYDGEVRQGTKHNDLEVYLSSIWRSAQLGKRLFSLDVNSAAVTAGDFLMPSQTVFPSIPTPITLEKALSSSKYAWCAIATENTAPGATSFAIFHGIAFVRCTGAVTYGNAVIPSGTDALVQSAGAAGSGFGPTVRGYALNNDNGSGSVWIHKCR